MSRRPDPPPASLGRLAGRRFCEQPLEIQRVAEHRELPACIARPLGFGAVAVQLDAVANRITKIERLAHTVVRGAVESKVGQARERATDTWDRLEKVFEDRVQRALTKLGVPGRDDLAELTRKVDTLTAELRKQGGKPAPRKAAKVTKVAKTVKKPAARKARSNPAA